jgi:hypothetical protein
MRSLTNLARLSTHLILVAIVCSCSSNIHTSGPTEDLEQIEAKLKSVVPSGWSVTRNGNVFQLTRPNKLWIYSAVNQDTGSTPDQWAKKTGVEVTYTITLRFEPLMPKDKYEQLKAERAPYEKIVNEGGGTIDEWARGVYEFNRRPVPVYFTDRYSIYAEKPDVFPERVYPESEATDCKQVISSLERLFNRYEPLSGKNSDFQVRTQ